VVAAEAPRQRQALAININLVRRGRLSAVGLPRRRKARLAGTCGANLRCCATPGDKIPLFGRKFAMLKHLTLLMILLALLTACAPAAPENRPTGTPENRATATPWL